MSHATFRYLPWPFPNIEFPADLGAFVMRSVLDGAMPGLQVLHDPEGGWALADGGGDPNDQRALVITHIRHVTCHDPSLNELATMQPGTEANLESVDDDWQLSSFSWDE